MRSMTVIGMEIPAQVRATASPRAARARRALRAVRHQLVSAAMLLAGMGLGLLGGALIGRWCLGLVLIAEAAGLIAVGLLRDDGTALPRRGSRSIGEVLEEERRYP